MLAFSSNAELKLTKFFSAWWEFRWSLTVSLRLHLHGCIFKLRWSLESKALLDHMCDVNSIAARLSSQTARMSHDHSTSHSTCSFKECLLFLLSSLWKLASICFTSMCVQSITLRYCDITHRSQALSLRSLYAVFCWNVNLAPGRWWQHWTCPMMTETACWDNLNSLVIFWSFPRHFIDVNTMCVSALGKYPPVPALSSLPPRVEALFHLGRSGLIRTNLKVFSPFLWNRNSVNKVVSINVGLIAPLNTGTVAFRWIVSLLLHI